MITKAEILEIKESLLTDCHNNRVKQQQTDKQYIDDGFGIPYIPTEVTQMKTGKAFRMTSAPAEHIISSHPLFYRTPVKDTDVPSADRIGQLGNDWLAILSRQNPNQFRVFIKNLLGQGEGEILILPRDNYNKDNPMEMPFDLVVPDPKIVFIDPTAGEINGVPNRMVISYDRVAQTIKATYPDWMWEKQENKKWTDKIPYFLYIDNDYRYLEADGEPLLLDNKGKPYNGEGIQENFYGSVPMVHAYAGFGQPAADGDPASLAVSRITHCRDLIKEYTAIRSVINYLIFQYAQPPLDFEYDPARFTPPDNFAEEYDRTPKSVNLVPVTGTGMGMKKGVDQLPDQQLFQHLYNIEQQIDEEDPLGQIGSIIGSSGRQQMDAKEGGLQRYATVVDNTATAFETAFGLMFKMCDMRPSLYPKILNKGDFKKNYSCTINLSTKDPRETELKRTDGDRKQANKIISWKENLTNYQEYTDEKAQTIMDETMVDDVILNDPIIRRIIAVQVAREMGLEQEYVALEEQLGQIEQGGGIGSQGGEPRTNNIKTQTGKEQADVSKTPRSLRRSPNA